MGRSVETDLLRLGEAVRERHKTICRGDDHLVIPRMRDASRPSKAFCRIPFQEIVAVDKSHPAALLIHEIDALPEGCHP